MQDIKRTIIFDEPSHTYKDEKGFYYTSVTTLIGKYEPKFDEKFWAEKKAKELNLPVEGILKNWKEIRDYSCDKGNKVHKTLEDSINESNGNAKLDLTPCFKNYYNQLNISSGCEVDIKVLGNSALAIKYPEIFLYILEHIENGWRLFAEKRIYWAEYLIAGTIDCLLVKGKNFKIVDWKTNKDELKFKAGYYKKVNGIKTNTWVDKDEKCFAPINHIQKCKGNTYTLQLSMYATLMELWGFICTGLILYHIRDNDKPKAYTIPYWKSDCIKLLIDNKNASNRTKISSSTTTFGIK